MTTITAILLAGGTGSRMNSETPKQFLSLNRIPVARYSFDVLAAVPEIKEIVVVCHPDYQHLFALSNSAIKLTFALPGKERQDSVYNGLMAASIQPDFICIHDSARPFINKNLVEDVINAAKTHGAATTATPIKFTIKEANDNGFVTRTPDRSLYWEVQTPQVIRSDLLQRGFVNAHHHHLSVTDDVSLVEHLGLPVQLVKGSYFNLKITTPEDLHIAEAFISLQK